MSYPQYPDQPEQYPEGPRYVALSAGLVMNGSREWANHKSGRSLSS